MAEPYPRKQFGTLLPSPLGTPSAATLVQVAAWHNRLYRLGVPLPLLFVHDFGLLLTQPTTTPRAATAAGLDHFQDESSVARPWMPEQIASAPGPTDRAGPVGPVTEWREDGSRDSPGIRDRSRSTHPESGLVDALPNREELEPLFASYASIVQSFGASELAEKARTLNLRDDLVAVLLHRLFSIVIQSYSDSTMMGQARELPLSPQAWTELDLHACWQAFDRAPLLGLLRFLASNRLLLQTAIDQVDVDTLRLLSAHTSDSEVSDPIDLLNAFRSVEATDIVAFSLDLLPSILETKRASSTQTFAIDGYASIERAGSLDAILPSELGYEEDLFEQRYMDRELLYYGHIRQPDERRRLHYLLIDSSPSMRGTRQVFARGLAVALSRRLLLYGDEVWFRFFDSRLYDLQRLHRGHLMTPYLLTFQSERGRHYARVFRELQQEAQRLVREHKQNVTFYLITHGECHVPRPIVEKITQLSQMIGIFVRPRAALELDYLNLLRQVHIVEPKSFESRNERRSRALEIVSVATGESQASHR